MTNSKLLVNPDESLGREFIDDKQDPLDLDLQDDVLSLAMPVPYSIFAYLKERYGADIAVPREIKPESKAIGLKDRYIFDFEKVNILIMLKNKNEGVKKVRIYDRKGKEIDTAVKAAAPTQGTKTQAKDTSDLTLAE